MAAQLRLGLAQAGAFGVGGIVGVMLSEHEAGIV
jgi:hypothetical protein